MTAELDTKGPCQLVDEERATQVWVLEHLSPGGSYLRRLGDGWREWLTGGRPLTVV